ncbi:MAG: class I SAM-dependent methyltransferase [Planctomycetes bacterium]|nr:class I SAM-dependent methyltransferase [Planctomycetota bacterium]
MIASTRSTLSLTPSPHIVRLAMLVKAGGPVLDVAAGNGRHAVLFADRGHAVTAIDRDVTSLRALADPRIEVIAADLERGPWPVRGRTFAAVVVSNYLWRPLLPTLITSVAPGGVLLYETFAVGNERHGRPRNPDFLLRHDELRQAVAGQLEVVEFEYGPVGDPPIAVRQRIAAIRPASR